MTILIKFCKVGELFDPILQIKSIYIPPKGSLVNINGDAYEVNTVIHFPIGYYDLFGTLEEDCEFVKVELFKI